ncbi:MAG: hypothetical protein HZB41_07325 [Ignavibacteriae bacterium]|nr:hypothetical protein [Ignavibacteriota bacterium]
MDWVWGSVDYWYFCKDEKGNFLDDCIEKVKIKFTNISSCHISKITFKLIINANETIIYKKQHIINVDIDYDETVPYDVSLTGKATCYEGQNYEDLRDEIKIISVK